MAYQTGTLNSLSDIQTVIRVFLTDNGWTWDAGDSTIHKDSVFINITVTATRVEIRGRTSVGSATGGYAAVGVMNDRAPLLSITFPATYYAFLNDDEFYFVINYDVARFQYLCFGKSTIDFSSLGGLGTFLSGSNNSYFAYGASLGPIYTRPSGLLSLNGETLGTTAAPFFMGKNRLGPPPSDFVHTNLDANAWALDIGDFCVGNQYAGNLLSVLPNAWNGESPLLPIRAYKRMAESKISLVLDLQHARQCRVDNFNDAEIINIGPDQWQVFPHHRKNTAVRDGANPGDHTGTLGWAIRKVD